MLLKLMLIFKMWILARFMNVLKDLRQIHLSSVILEVQVSNN